MSMFSDMHVKCQFLHAKKFGKGQWSLHWVVRKSGTALVKDSPQGVWDNMAERMFLEFAESDCPIFRASSPLSRGRLRSKEHGKLSIHHAADLGTIETIFRIIVSAQPAQSLREQSRRHVKSVKPFMKRTVRPVVMVQSSSSLVLSVIKTEVSLDCGQPRSSVAAMWRTNSKAVTTRRRISEYC